ncbi:MAG TPA: HAMP domain-containing sensor histidine kinase [Mesorhizobium sp.]|jgi:signal transduction histidine kinase
MALTLPAALKTTAVRLSALYLILFTACALALALYMTSISARMLTTQTQEAVTDEVGDLARSYKRGGLQSLVRAVASRSRQPGANLYLIADPQGRILTGNVESLEPGVLDGEGWTQRPFSYRRFGEGEPPQPNADAGEDEAPVGTEGETVSQVSGNTGHQAIALVLRLPNQMTLLVGRDLREPEVLRAVVGRALTIALGMMGVGGLLIWLLVGRRALKRIDDVSLASRRIMGGDLSGRLPVSGAGDEFDRLSENLNAMLARIGELNDGLKQVSDNIAHDLKTPLTRLRNRAEAALSGQSKPAQYRAALEATIGESDTLIKTFNAILMISRLEAGYSAEQLSPVDVSQAVDDVVELYEPVAEDAGVSLRAQKPAEPISISGNRELLAQALSNVVDNAIKYSAGEGQAPAVTVTLSKSGDEIRLTVDDNGPGIPEASDRQRVTERFVRLEMSRSQPGSGLGLSLASAIVKYHGGRLDLLPLDPGLSVTMIFPAPKAGE